MQRAEKAGDSRPDPDPKKIWNQIDGENEGIRFIRHSFILIPNNKYSY